MKNILPALLLTILLHHPTISRAQGAQTPTQQGPQEPALQITPSITRTVIDSLTQALKHSYVFPDTAAKMAAYLAQQYKKGAYTTIHDPNELAIRLLKDLQKAHHDGHLRLHYAPGMADMLEKDRTDTTGVAARRRIGDSLGLIQARQQNFAFQKVEILPGNIGYVKFNGFVGFQKEARPTFTAAFRFVANTQALIIDMRDNGGGSPAMVCQVASYFFATPQHWNDIIGPHGNMIFYTDPKDVDSLILSMPVYILTSKYTFSGAEDFTYGMKSLHRATIIGDTTGGGAHPVGPVPITMGFVADIPFARSLNPYTHTDWEGTGVYPDVPVREGEALDRAKQAILTDRVHHATTEEEKNQAQWQLDDITARQPQHMSDNMRADKPANMPAGLAAYCGTYQGGLVFYVDHGDLYCKNAERGGYVSKLLFISGDKFVLDENVHVEFINDNDGTFNKLTMLWSNGGVTQKPKEK